MAQWTTRLTTNQKIAGSSPARIEVLGFCINCLLSSFCTALICITNISFIPNYPPPPSTMQNNLKIMKMSNVREVYRT